MEVEESKITLRQCIKDCDLLRRINVYRLDIIGSNSKIPIQ